MAAINNLVISLLRLTGFTNLAAARRYCDADLANVLNLLASTIRQFENLGGHFPASRARWAIP